MQTMKEYGFIRMRGFHLGTFDQSKETHYQIRKKGNGIYVFILKGSAEIGGEILEERDGFGGLGYSGYQYQSH